VGASTPHNPYGPALPVTGIAFPFALYDMKLLFNCSINIIDFLYISIFNFSVFDFCRIWQFLHVPHVSDHTDTFPRTADKWLNDSNLDHHHHHHHHLHPRSVPSPLSLQAAGITSFSQRVTYCLLF
jgi:hypothetical protein